MQGGGRSRRETATDDNAYLQITRQDGCNLTVIGCDSFCFETHDFSLDALTRAQHVSELKKDGQTHLYIDYRMRGLGSHSCGPVPEAPYELSIHPFTFAFVLAANCTESDALRLARTDFGITSGKNDSVENKSGAFAAGPVALL